MAWSKAARAAAATARKGKRRRRVPLGKQAHLTRVIRRNQRRVVAVKKLGVSENSVAVKSAKKTIATAKRRKKARAKVG